MRIAIYHNQHAGGAARVIEEWAKRARRNHHLELFTPDTADTGFVNLKPYVKKQHRFPIPGSETPFGRYRRVQAVPAYGREIAAAIDAGGFDAVFANLSYVTQSPEILPYLKTPSLYYAPEPLRAVYDESPFPEPRTAKSTAKQAFFSAYDARRKRFDRRAIKQATRVMTHSHFTKRVLKRIYDVNAAVVHLGVDTTAFRPLNRKRDRSVISVGALHPLKGHQFVIDALATLPETDRPELVVVGPRGDFSRTLAVHAKRQGVRVRFELSVPNRRVIELYNRAGVMAAAQYQEPFGLITLEAMATKTPVVAVREGGLAETVTDGKTGLLVKRNPKQFGQALQRVLADPRLATRLGTAGRRDAEKNWTWDRTAKGIDHLLSSVAKIRS